MTRTETEIYNQELGPKLETALNITQRNKSLETMV